jgi:hypothetical protein
MLTHAAAVTQIGEQAAQLLEPLTEATKDQHIDQTASKLNSSENENAARGRREYRRSTQRQRRK